MKEVENSEGANGLFSKLMYKWVLNQKKFSKKFEKPLDNKLKVCYNKDVSEREKVKTQKTLKKNKKRS